MDQFIFSPLTQKDIDELSGSSNVFNLTRGDVEHEKIILSSFEDERLGSSTEHLDLAIYDGDWKLLDIDSIMGDNNEVMLGYLLRSFPEHSQYTKVLVIIRMMSSMLTDKVKSSTISYMYHIVPGEYQEICKNKALLGNLARNHICLDGSDETRESLKKLGLLDEVNSIIGKEA